jgi:hypothetical protein
LPPLEIRPVLGIARGDGAHRALDQMGEIERLAGRDRARRRGLGNRRHRRGRVPLRVEPRQRQFDRRAAARRQDAGEEEALRHGIPGHRSFVYFVNQRYRARIDNCLRHQGRPVARAERPPGRIAGNPLAPMPARIALRRPLRHRRLRLKIQGIYRHPSLPLLPRLS